MQLGLLSIHEKAWLASTLSLAASCLSFSVISLGSAKLRVDSAGDGMADEGGVVEEREEEDDSLMLTININTPSVVLFLLYLVLFVLGLIRSGQSAETCRPTKMIITIQCMLTRVGNEQPPSLSLRTIHIVIFAQSHLISVQSLYPAVEKLVKAGNRH